MRKKNRQLFPDFAFEHEAHAHGYQQIAGVDEVGRGPLAGPVVAAAVMLNPDAIPDGLNDSKKLSAKRREELFAEICTSAHVAIASMNSEVVDRVNIRIATHSAMIEAVNALSQRPDFILIDGRDVPDDLSIEARAIIKGDSYSQSIAAASIVAKVTRDQMMVRANNDYPGYDFHHHKGYGSKRHLDAIKELGPCPLHRRSFAPVKYMPDHFE